MKVSHGLIATFVFFAGIVSNSIGTVRSWANSGSDWATGTNWGGTAPVDDISTDTATFVTGTVVNPNLSASRSIGGITITGSSSYIFTSNSGSTVLTIGGGGLVANLASTQTLNLPVRLGASQLWVSNAINSTLNVSGPVDTNGFALTLQSGNTGTTSNINITNVVSGSGSITKTGNSTLTLSAANTYSGGTTIGGSNSGTVNINNGGIEGSSSAIGTGTLSISGSATINNTSGTSVTLSSNNAQSWSGTSATLTFVGTNDLNLGTGAVTLLSNRTISTTSGNLTVGGIISGSSFGLIKTGSGTLTLSGANTYTGVTTINNGVLAISSIANGGAASGLGQSTNAAGNLIFNGGTLRYEGSSSSSTNRLFQILAGGATIDSSGSGSLSFSNPGSVAFSTPAGDRSLTLTGTNTSNNTIELKISDKTAVTETTSVTKTGAGRWILTGANDYTGATTISGGTLAFSSGALGTGSIIMNGGTLQWNGSNTQDVSSRILMVAAKTSSFDTNGNSFSFANAIGGSTSAALVKIGSGTLTFNNTNTYTGGTTVSVGTIALGHATDTLADTGGVTISGGTLALGSNSDTVGNVALTSGAITGSGTLTGLSYAVESGTISASLGGSGALIKTTGGTVFLSGSNTYSGGTTVSAGILSVESSGALAGGALTINGGDLTTSVSNANLGGGVDFSSGSITLNATGTGSLTLAAASNFVMSGGTLNVTLGASIDQIIGNGGSFSIASGTINFDTSGGGVNYASSYQLFQSFGSGSVSGVSFTGLTGYTANLSNTGSLTFTANAIPEPSTYAVIVGALALAGVAIQRRRGKVVLSKVL